MHVFCFETFASSRLPVLLVPSVFFLCSARHRVPVTAVGVSVGAISQRLSRHSQNSRCLPHRGELVLGEFRNDRCLIYDAQLTFSTRFLCTSQVDLSRGTFTYDTSNQFNDGEDEDEEEEAEEALPSPSGDVDLISTD